MKAFAIMVLILCVAYGALGRWESVRALREAAPGDTLNLSHDEAIFLTLGKKLSQGGSDYHVREWYEQQSRVGRRPPEYLDRPLFKHPPMLPILLSLVGEPGLQGARNAFWVMACFGIAASLLTFALARLLLPPLWSLAAAAMAWIDPILWAGSVKVWVDLPLTVFSLAGLWLAWLGRERPALFMAAGFCFGLAFLTKYPAILIWAVAMTLIWTSDSRLRKNRWFWVGALLPWAMLAPWLWKYFSVYGAAALDLPELRHVLRLGWSHAWGLAAAAVLIWLAWRALRAQEAGSVSGRVCFFALFFLTVAGLMLFPGWFSPRAEPRAGTAMGFFDGENALFYVGRVLNLDPLLWPGLLAACLLRLPAPGSTIRWTVVAYFFVFSLWGNYQSRYIMPVIPLLCVLSGWFLWRMAEWLREDRSLWLERTWVWTWAFFVVCRLEAVNARLTIPNRFTYF